MSSDTPTIFGTVHSRYGAWVITITCPYCGDRHTHGGGALDEAPEWGYRYAHCTWPMVRGGEYGPAYIIAGEGDQGTRLAVFDGEAGEFDAGLATRMWKHLIRHLSEPQAYQAKTVGQLAPGRRDEGQRILDVFERRGIVQREHGPRGTVKYTGWPVW